MVKFLSINIFSWISSIFVGFFKRSRFFVLTCIIVSVTRGQTNIKFKSIKKPDEQSVCPKHVKFFTKIKLRNCAS